MERRGTFALVCRSSVLCVLFLLSVALGTEAQATRPQDRESFRDLPRRLPRARAVPHAVENSMQRLPLNFEVNRGQAPESVRFLSRGARYSLFLSGSEAVIALQQQRASQKDYSQRRGAAHPGPDAPAVVRIGFDNSKPTAILTGEEELPGRSSYFIGNDPRKWRAGILNYARVHYHEIYRGIDVLYYGNRGHLEHDFIVQPGADPRQIALRVTGADRLEINNSGDLVMYIGSSSVSLQRPVAYQQLNGTRREIAASYVLDEHSVRLQIGDYDRRRPLVIDPVLAFSTYIGGSGDELFINGNIDGAITLDSTGNIYIAGETLSTSFAFPGFSTVPGLDKGCGTDTPPTCNSATGPFGDIFIAKLNSSATVVTNFTYLGGSGEEILALAAAHGGLVVDSTGVYVSGTTFSADYPTTPGVFAPNCPTPAACTNVQNFGDGFVTKLDLGLSTLLFST